jgi:hypothetical protein
MQKVKKTLSMHPFQSTGEFSSSSPTLFKIKFLVRRDKFVNYVASLV